jgi:hypothetical protein
MYAEPLYVNCEFFTAASSAFFVDLFGALGREFACLPITYIYIYIYIYIQYIRTVNIRTRDNEMSLDELVKCFQQLGDDHIYRAAKCTSGEQVNATQYYTHNNRHNINYNMASCAILCNRLPKPNFDHMS